MSQEVRTKPYAKRIFRHKINAKIMAEAFAEQYDREIFLQEVYFGAGETGWIIIIGDNARVVGVAGEAS